MDENTSESRPVPLLLGWGAGPGPFKALRLRLGDSPGFVPLLGAVGLTAVSPTAPMSNHISMKKGPKFRSGCSQGVA